MHNFVPYMRNKILYADLNLYALLYLSEVLKDVFFTYTYMGYKISYMRYLTLWKC